MTLGPKQGAALMRRKSIVPALWDDEFPKQRLQARIAQAKDERAERDWQSAEIQVERAISDEVGTHRSCALSRCRRTRRCIGNPPVCWQPRIIEHVIPAKLQEWMEQVYVAIQQERAAATREGRAPRVLSPVANTKRRNSKPSSPGSTGRPSIRER
jgi:hypothetical protein